MIRQASNSYFEEICSALKISPNTSGWPDNFGDSLRKWTSRQHPRPLRILSLFSGGGGLDIGFHDSGFQATDLVEIESRFAQSLIDNSGDEGYLGNGTVHCIDIRRFFPRNMRVDFIIGGPPCQSFSAAGRRAAGVRGVNDSRGVLFKEYVRLLKTLKPRGFLFENVYGITGANNGKAWRDIQDAFSSAGYKISSRILDSADFGVPQHRERLFIVGLRGKTFAFPRPTHGPDSRDKRPYYSAGLAVSSTHNYEVAQPVGGRYGKMLDEIPPGLNYSFFTSNLGHPRPMFAWRSKFSDFLYKADPAKPIRTLKAQGGQYTGPFHWKSRKFTTTELKRLQTFPDRYKLSGGKSAAAHQLGNSVPPQIARILALAVRDQVFGLNPPAPMDYLHDSEPLGFRNRKRLLTAYYQELAAKRLHKKAPVARATTIQSRSYLATLSKNFALIQNPATSSEEGFDIRLRISKRDWNFSITPHTGQMSKGFVINVSPKENNRWDIPADRVIIEGHTLDLRAFTLGWKILELELSRLRIKADLVQLCGYYQYEPSFSSDLTLRAITEDPIWKTLIKISSGSGVRKILSTRDLAQIWDIPVDDVLNCAVRLKEAGYEIRNRNTNPEIPRSHFLIPYSFPTLSPASVQLRKQLVKEMPCAKPARLLQTTELILAS